MLTVKNENASEENQNSDEESSMFTVSEMQRKTYNQNNEIRW